MIDILESIISHKRKEVAERKESLPLDKLLKTRELQFERKTNSMLGALKRSPSGIIAEFKRKSPSKGWLFPDAKVEEIVPAYESGGASVCSVLTDYEFFGGSLSDLERARELVRLPLLRKDFIVDEYQIYEARAAGADAILLIATVLQPVECIKLARMACKLHLQVLLEIHTPEELNRLNPYIDMVGVNNRNLGTFHTDVNNSFRLMEHIQRELGDDPAFRLFVSESGLSDIQTIHELRNVGFRGFLIGETLMKTPDPGKTLKELILELDEKK